jgi:TorA maturation chaperone TorD
MNTPQFVPADPDGQIASATTDPHVRAFCILTHIADSRRCVYRWLSLGFYPPGAELVAALNSGQLQQEIAASIDWLGNDQLRLTDGLRGLGRCANLQLAGLEAEYTRLFGKSVDQVSTRELAYRQRDEQKLPPGSESIAHELQQRYGNLNMQSTGDQEDHVAVELEFLAHLCACESVEWAAGESESARSLRRQQRAFLDDHLGCRLGEFCQRVLERSPQYCYGPLATLSDAWLSLEYGPGYLLAVKS